MVEKRRSVNKCHACPIQSWRCDVFECCDKSKYLQLIEDELEFSFIDIFHVQVKDRNYFLVELSIDIDQFWLGIVDEILPLTEYGWTNEISPKTILRNLFLHNAMHSSMLKSNQSIRGMLFFSFAWIQIDP